MLQPSEAEFETLAHAGFNLLPVCREIAADLETPVSAFLKIADDRDYAFLLESVSGGEKWARYSFLGAEPSLVMKIRGDRVESISAGGAVEIRHTVNPLGELRQQLDRVRAPELPYLPRFFGGAVGFMAYDLVRSFERIPARTRDDLAMPDLCLMFTGTILVFDNVRQSIKVIANVALDEFASARAAYQAACGRIDQAIEKLAHPARLPRRQGSLQSAAVGPVSNLSRDEYLAQVERAREYIAAGDVIQVVLSQRFEAPLRVHPLNLYRSLRAINPSPYMFYLRLGEDTLCGASPEVMVRVEGREVTVRPIAGTRSRGVSEAEDLSLERDLLNDPKERAEHVMLVDLARNDIGRVARTGSVEVSDLMGVERYSHVMHMVSNVRGVLREEADACDAFRATFPQGTVSGAPKIRAMEIIDELEPVRRGVYGGAVGYFSYTGNADTAIVLRTMLIKNERVYLQAGGGIVADSKPEAEYEESLHKARAMIAALSAAEEFERAAGRE
ncbi:MAG: anthranilate synthase component I [Candidatus Binataceae bacterium]|nr:anthranilate synthase component I [Candidatus Binataceae bacterium]